MLLALPTEVPDMEILDFVTLMQIKDMATGMTKEEILSTFSIDPEDFSKDEVIYFDEFYNYGKGMGVHKVVNNLITQSRYKGGIPAAMAYLRRFSEEFEKEVEGDSSGEFNFKFGNID
jgi:hypothetical protein